MLYRSSTYLPDSVTQHDTEGTGIGVNIVLDVNEGSLVIRDSVTAVVEVRDSVTAEGETVRDSVTAEGEMREIS